MLALLYIGEVIEIQITHQRMIKYNIASAREDGALNRVVMNGKAGYIGYSTIRLQYLEDGWISLSGDNMENENGWKLLSIFTLEPGTYTLTGVKNLSKNTISLQLYIEDDIGLYHYLYQYNEDVRFVIKRTVKATLHVRVYPEVGEVNVKIRPAVYRDE